MSSCRAMNAKGRMRCPAPKRKLTAEQVVSLRSQYAAGVATRELGRRFGLGHSTAHRIAIGEVYRDVANDNVSRSTG